jgi:F0F1-type ATP synthase gamma subunit
MAKIWYSIFGEGMGHAIRSWTVIQELKKKHEIFITVCGKAVSYIKKKFPDAHEIQGYNFVYENNSVAIRKTASQFLKTFFKKAKEGDRDAECLLPNELSRLIEENKIRMKVYPAVDKWIGVTNPEDEEVVRKILAGS